MTYRDLQEIHNPATDAYVPVAWLDQVRDNDEALSKPPACQAYSTTQTLSNGSLTTLTFASERFVTDDMHNSSSSTGILQANTAGYYLFAASGYFTNNATGFRYVRATRNGLYTKFGLYRGASHASNTTRIAFAFGFNMAAGDTMIFEGYQNSGGDLAIAFEVAMIWVSL